jgi:hypothetical protein
MALDERRLAFIGGGHITTIIIDNLVRAEKAYTHRLIVSDPDKNKLQKLYNKYEITMADDNPDAVNTGTGDRLHPMNCYRKPARREEYLSKVFSHLSNMPSEPL